MTFYSFFFCFFFTVCADVCALLAVYRNAIPFLQEHGACNVQLALRNFVPVSGVLRPFRGSRPPRTGNR